MKHLFASIVLVAACGGDPLDPGSGNDPGSGTTTLLVEGSVSANPREGLVNASHAADFESEIRVRITLNGQPVQTGTVTVASKLVTAPLVWDQNIGNTGMWRGTAAGYDEVYQLDIVSGPDEVHDVIVDGPDFHVFTLPTLGASLDSTLALDVEWDREDVADVATFRVGDVNRITIADNGLYTMAPNSLRAEKDRPRENTIEVQRSNHVTPAGAIGGSQFTVSVENDLNVIALANPNLP